MERTHVEHIQEQGLMQNLVKNYVFWTYERGTLHYDVMVTAILLFLFLSPRFIDYKDRPVETVALHSSEVLVKEAGMDGDRARFIYQVRADDMGHPANKAERDAAILRLVEPVSGEVTLQNVEEVKDAAGRIIAYNATILR
jgi:hypothetical protein